MAEPWGLPKQKTKMTKNFEIRRHAARRGFTGTSMQEFKWRVPRQPSARLTHGLKLDTALWLLRCSVFRETPMAFSCNYFKKLNCYETQDIPTETVGWVFER
jgi:hypothetical protein